MKTEQILRIPYFLITELHILQIPLPQLWKLRPIILQSMKLMSDKTGENEKKLHESGAPIKIELLLFNK
jgi:hypothetical protein